MEHFGKNPEIPLLQKELRIENKVASDIENLLMKPNERLQLQGKILHNIASLNTQLSPTQIASYDEWIELHLLHDDIRSRSINYTKEYQAYEDMAIQYLKMLEYTEEDEFMEIHNQYISVIKHMGGIQYINNTLRNNQNEPPDLA